MANKKKKKKRVTPNILGSKFSLFFWVFLCRMKENEILTIVVSLTHY